MLKSVDFYFFSPTGGTKKVGECLANSVAESAVLHDLSDKKSPLSAPEGGLSIIALPVFGGRIPAFVAEKLKHIRAEKKKAATIVVYGNRAYEDALLELNNIAEESGFEIVASGAFVAQHSMCPEVGEGRPDEKDFEDIKNFGEKILDKLSGALGNKISVPGNYPYKADFIVPATPISTDFCSMCGKCITACPTDAISILSGKIATDFTKCALCMACVKTCPSGARILPPPMSEKIRQMLSKFKGLRRENETYI